MRDSQRRIIVLKKVFKGTALLGTLTLSTVAYADKPNPGAIGLQAQVTDTGRYAEWMHNTILMYTITAISVFVLALLIWVAFRYRAKANPTPSKTSHNTTIEIVWTLVPALILAAIAFPSFKLLAEQTAPAPRNAITVKAIGHQWYWSYQYPDLGDFEIIANMLPDAEAIKRGEPRLLATDNRIVLPVGVPIRLQTTSEDVIHAWFVPAFWTQMDAVPGRINEGTFTIEKEGVYYGQCNQICGARHGYMPITVEAVSKPAFDAWVAAKKAPAATPVAIPAAPASATPVIT
jgi:cytochrome c oxidase subunit II